MKKTLFPATALLLLLASCEKEHDVFFRIGKELEYEFSDLELYDTSTHIMYFKKEHEELKTLQNGTFDFLNKGNPVYSGTFWPGYSSSMPTGPYISTQPSFYGNYALRIMIPGNTREDARKDPAIINLLNLHNLLHSGLSVSSAEISISGFQLTFRFTVTNHDESDLMIIDLDKTGPALFHYFTNGLYILDQSGDEVFAASIQHQSPDPWNSWKPEWLSELKSGESRDFTINYIMSNTLDPGAYTLSFEFPGLAYQVTRDQLYIGNSRIWLGDVRIRKKISIE